MPRYPSNLERYAAQICSLRQRSVQLEINSLGFPLFVYSYSSRGFPDLPERYIATKDLGPVQLVSLYDVHYYLRHIDTPNPSRSQPMIRFFDSGRYEVEKVNDSWKSEQFPGLQPWSEELYIKCANNSVHEADVLVAYDDRSLGLIEQIRQSQAAFARVEVQHFKRDLLLHPNGIAPDGLAEAIADGAPEIDIIGLTEKDIGYPWFIAASYISQLRTKLDALFERYIPIHIFGCFDPQTIPYLFFSGADIFDGLAWMRHYFRDGHAFYDKEFEYSTSPEKLMEPALAMQSLLAHNVEELESLRADLRYAVLTRDLSQFEQCVENLKAFELASPSQHVASRKATQFTAGENNGR